MRTIARGNTPENCLKRVNQLKNGGWTPVSEIRIDPSPSIDISFVCVLERAEDKDKPAKKNRFNQRIYGGFVQ